MGESGPPVVCLSMAGPPPVSAWSASSCVRLRPEGLFFLSPALRTSFERGPFNRCLQLLPPLLQLPSYLLKTGQPHALALYYLLPLQCNFLDFFRFLSGCMACSSRSQVIFLAICSLLLSQLQSGCQRDEQSLYHLRHIFLPKFNF